MASSARIPLLLLLSLCLFCTGTKLASALGGPCSRSVEQIAVKSQEDIISRTQYPSTRTVRLVLQNDITVSRSIQFSQKYQCTIFTSATGGNGLGFNVTTANDSFPAILVWNTSNVLIQNVGFRLPQQQNYATCKTQLPQPDDQNSNCPAISVYSSWGVQIVQATVHGRIDILSTNQSLFDSLLIKTEASNFAAVRLSSNGDGPKLERSDVVISNNKIYGSTDGILLYRGAVGVTIAFNYFENNFFTAIQCGKNVHNIGDCMLSTIVNNYIHVTPGYVTVPDSGSIYFDTHWTNPGNYLSCNHIINGVHCLYLDWVSSGVTVEGHVCFNTTAGLKLNTGKNNQVSSFLVVQPAYQAGWISCQNYDLNNCLRDPGSWWEAQRLLNYNSPQFRQRYPYLNNLCDKTSINGIPCNAAGDPPANVTGACSGLPTENRVRITVVDPKRYQKSLPDYIANCGVFKNVPKINSISYDVYTAEDMKFLDKEGLDFGVAPTSAAYINEPKFKSCPRSAAGVQPVDTSRYLQYFNSPKRFWRNRGSSV